MTTPAVIVLACGISLGAAAVLILVALLRPAPVDLATAMKRLDARLRGETEPPAGRARWLQQLADRSGESTNRWWGIPAAEIDLLDITATRYVARRLMWAGSGAVLVAGCWLIAVLAGLDIPVALVGLAVTAGGIGGSLVPPLSVAEDAQLAREEFRRTVAAYLDLVAQERATGRAPTQALTEAAAVADSWVFTRIRSALATAVRMGTTPWEALTRLAQRVGVAELADLADIVATAADGAAVYTTLTAQARSLRSSAVTAEKAAANQRSEHLTVPGILLLLGFLILLLFPTTMHLFPG